MKRLLLTVCALTGVFAGLAEDGYLESDGTQALNLGYIATPTTRIEYDFQLLSTANNGAFVCGAYGGNLSYGVWKNSGGNFEFKFNNVFSTGKGKADVQRHVCTIDMATGACRLLTDGSETASYTCTSLPTKNASYPLAAFAGGNNEKGTSFNYRAATRLYWIKVYESDVLVRSYVPCVKGDQAGFFEEKSGQFLAPDIAVASGGDVMEIDGDPYVSTPNGGVIVDTGYYCSEKTRLECDYEMLDDTTTDQFLFSAGFTANFEVRGYVGTSGAGTLVINYQFSTNHNLRASTSTPVGKGIRRTLTIDGAAGTASLVTGVTTNYALSLAYPYGGTCTDTLRLFCISSENTAKCAKMKLYGFRIYEDGVLVRDYRPALIDGVAVLSDVVGGSWIKSKTATELSSGGAIAENNDAYLESDGRQGINLDYKVKTTSRVEVDFRYLSAGAATYPRLLIGGGAAASAADNPIRFGMAQNSDGNFEFCFPMKVGSYWSGGLFAADTKRHVGILDVPNRKGSYTRFGSAESSATSTTNLTADSTYPLGLFGTTHSVNGNSFYADYASAVRIYDVKIYESDVLVKHWIPYVHNGELGLKETVSDTFLNCNNGRKTLPDAGGALGYDSCPPYVESDGTQCVNLGVKPKKNARIETAFSLFRTNITSRGIVGSMGLGTDKTFFWVNGGGNFEACLNGKYSGGLAKPDFAMHTGVLDYAPHTAYFDGAATVLSIAAPTADATMPFGVFGQPKNAAGTQFSNAALPARVYYVKIYEGDALTNEFVPWVKDGVVGFRDTVTDAFVTKYQTSAAALTIGGIGTSCALAASSNLVPVDGTVTLTAGASGAVSYKWYRNGVEIDGETGTTLSVAWRHQRATDTYAVRPAYQLYGETILGDEVEATVAYAKVCLVITIK